MQAQNIVCTIVCLEPLPTEKAPISCCLQVITLFALLISPHYFFNCSSAKPHTLHCAINISNSDVNQQFEKYLSIQAYVTSTTELLVPVVEIAIY